MNKQAHYLRIYKNAEEIIKQHDPCKIEVLEDGRIKCAAGVSYDKGVSKCCGGCKYMGPEGCTVKSLGCKIGWCYCASDTIQGMTLQDSPAFIEMRELRSEARMLGVPLLCRGSMADSFGYSKEPNRDYNFGPL